MWCRPAAGYAEPYFGAADAISFWKRGSLRSGSNIGSSRSNAGVSGGFAANGASYGIESSLVKVEMERSGSPMRAATRARISSGLGPVSASLSMGNPATSNSPLLFTLQFLRFCIRSSRAPDNWPAPADDRDCMYAPTRAWARLTRLLRLHW
jgi:hypothetical protein